MGPAIAGGIRHRVERKNTVQIQLVLDRIYTGKLQAEEIERRKLFRGMNRREKLIQQV